MRADDEPPPGWMRWAEMTSVWPRLWRGLGHLGPRGPEGGPPGLVVPGFIANDRTTMELRRALGDAGWRVHPWDNGFNWGARADSIDRLSARLDQIDDPRPVLLVGWSLGGMFARELARARPERVRAVITLGSPFSGDPKRTNIWRLYERIAGHKVDDPPVPRILEKPPVPTLAIWSRRDGIVPPRLARGLDGERDHEVELDSSHMGFALSRRTADAVVREIDSFLEIAR
ncbi:MAG: alpha/beta fold hydrolase [Sphingomicrobium sp.]